MAQVVFRDTYRDILSPGQMEYMMDMMYSEDSMSRQMEELGHMYFIEDGKGYVSFRFDGRDEDGTDVFHLEKLYVMPGCRGEGIGRALFGTIVHNVRALSAGPARLELNVNRLNPAVGFYEHLGMRKARSGDFPIGRGFYMNDYIMSMNL